MREISIKLYNFDELSEESKKKVIENNSDINVDYDWTDWLDEEFDAIQLKLKSFSTYEQHIDMDFWYDAEATAQEVLTRRSSILDEVYDITLEFLRQYLDCRDNDEARILAREEYISNLAKFYLKLLSKEYEYRTSDESVAETLMANEYEFTEDGKLY